MGFYENRVLPLLIDIGCGAAPIAKQRQKVVPHAEGRILEVGMGSGLNVPFYDPAKVEFVWGLEPSEGMRRKAQQRVESAKFEIRGQELRTRIERAPDPSITTLLSTPLSLGITASASGLESRHGNTTQP